LLKYWKLPNERAIQTFQKCGFVVEGILRQNEYVDGQYYDTVIMGLLREDYFRAE
jgi:RimJ/RimL family protein N-acetyltransferase